MNNRRMFSNRIANSARFLQMPDDAQLLYFHMVLRADDDGVVEAYPIIKLIGSSPDSFKVLIAKGFIQELNIDQVIVIKNWTEHNKIRQDRKVDSIYKSLLLEVCPEIDILEAKPRSDVKDNTKRISSGQSTDGISKVKLSKVNLNKERETPSQINKSFFSLEEDKRIYFLEKIIARGLSQSERAEISKFVSYWTEPNKSGTKQRWEMEKTFDLNRRIRTWFDRASRYNPEFNKKLTHKKY